MGQQEDGRALLAAGVQGLRRFQGMDREGQAGLRIRMGCPVEPAVGAVLVSVAILEMEGSLSPFHLCGALLQR